MTTAAQQPPVVTERARMFWMGVGLTLVAGVIAIGIIVAKSRTRDLGSVSDHWLAHRVGFPVRF